MPRYLSQYRNFYVPVQASSDAPVTKENGVTVMIATKPHLGAQFRPGHLGIVDYATMQAAKAYYKHSFRGLGSTVLEEDGTASSKDDLINGRPYDGQPAELRFSVFDTDWVPEEHRALYEQKLDTHPDLGTAFIKLADARTVKPFPAYDDITGAGADKKLGRILRDIGGNADEWSQYERENQNRESVLAEYARVVEERQKLAAEAKVLSATL